MIQRSTDSKIRVLSLSYGKDSMACFGAIEELGLPLDRVVTAEVWATDTIPADLPPMVEFKAKADAIIKERWGFEVEHVCATKPAERERERERREPEYGFPVESGLWCNSGLEVGILSTYKTNLQRYLLPQENEGRNTNDLRFSDATWRLVHSSQDKTP